VKAPPTVSGVTSPVRPSSELEPPDPHVLKAEEIRGHETIETSRMAIDIDEIYREADRDLGSEIVERWFRDFKFRFQVKHIFVSTAILAILLTLFHLGILGQTLIIVVMLAVCGVYLYLQWHEMKQQQGAERRRNELYARRRAEIQRRKEGGFDSDLPDEPLGPISAALAASKTATAVADDDASPAYQFRFSMKQLIIAMTAAAITLAFVRFMGGPNQAATMLGLLALVGLVVHAAGYTPPAVVVLGWWFILVLYVLVSIAAGVWSLAT